MQIAVIGLDMAKNVFQVHGIDDSGHAVLKRKLRRSEVLPFFAGLAPALVGIEAYHTAHYWSVVLLGAVISNANNDESRPYANAPTSPDG
jgi:transposase